MVVLPCLSEYLALLVDLICNVVSQLLQSILELFLEGIQGGVYVIHGFHCLLTIFLNLAEVKTSWLCSQ